MTKAIIVVTYPGSPWLKACVESLQPTKYPVMLCINPKGKSAYDPAGFYYAREHEIEEFIIMHDSMVIKDVSMFEKAFSMPGNISFSGIPFLMCFGKYELKKIPPLPPKPTNKLDGILFESLFARKAIPCDATLFPEFGDTNVFVEKHGKKRMVLENDYVIKYKGCWNPNMAEDLMVE